MSFRKIIRIFDISSLASDSPNYEARTLKKLNVTANGRPVYDCDYANHCVNIKNLLEYNRSYAKSIGTNEFYFFDTSRSANEDKYAKRNVEHARTDENNAYRVLPMVDGDN